MRTLVVGYGNPDRQDDGVAWQVIAALRQRLGQRPLAEDETGLEQLEGEADSIQLLQLGPELLETAVQYEQLIFVDAHVRQDRRDLFWETIEAAAAPAAFTHHMTPAMFLALLAALYGARPDGMIVSIRGHQFDFARALSAATQALVEPAVELIVQRLVNPYEKERET
jgi:hydrogenase maturation protease